MTDTPLPLFLVRIVNGCPILRCPVVGIFAGTGMRGRRFRFAAGRNGASMRFFVMLAVARESDFQ